MVEWGSPRGAAPSDRAWVAIPGVRGASWVGGPGREPKTGVQKCPKKRKTFVPTGRIIKYPNKCAQNRVFQAPRPDPRKPPLYGGSEKPPF